MSRFEVSAKKPLPSFTASVMALLVFMSAVMPVTPTGRAFGVVAAAMPELAGAAALVPGAAAAAATLEVVAEGVVPGATTAAATLEVVAGALS